MSIVKRESAYETLFFHIIGNSYDMKNPPGRMHPRAPSGYRFIRSSMSIRISIF